MKNTTFIIVVLLGIGTFGSSALAQNQPTRRAEFPIPTALRSAGASAN